jgi:hypothetical protein
VAQTVFDVGDPVTTRLSLGVAPDGTTVATVQLHAPDGSTSSPSVAGPSGQDYTAQFTASQAGDYVAVWTVTGTGAGVQAKVYNVRALPVSGATRPSWVPFLSDVADQIPHKSQDLTVGSDVLLMTFTGTTRPDDATAQRITDSATATVLATVPTVTAAMASTAKAAVVFRAAADIELAFPERTVDMTVYDRLNDRANAELKTLQGLADQTGNSAEALDPMWSFPEAPAWADDKQMLL